MNPLDIALLLLAGSYAVSGFRQGFLIGALGVVGLIGGGLLGAVLGPIVLSRFAPSTSVALAALGAVVLCALVAQTALATLGEKIRSQVAWRPAYLVDATAGALLSVIAVLVVAWILGAAVAGSHLGSFAKIARESRILAQVDRIMPSRAETGLLAFGKVVNPGLFPRYLDPFTPEQITPVAPPSTEVVADPDVQSASTSVVRITGPAYECSRTLEGSGFVYAPGRVMTNAHVVAGVSDPQVEDRQGRRYDAEVVLYDPSLDVAVLSAPDLTLDPLTFDETAEANDEAVVLGYPENGPFWSGPARIRAEQRLRGPDIYGADEVVRDVFSIRAQVRPGNSGGPLISEEGDVIGVIFAASVEDPSTGYALTAEQVAEDARAGIQASSPVSTGSCA